MTFENNEDLTTEDRDGELQEEQDLQPEEQQEDYEDDSNEDEQSSNPDKEDLRQSKNLAVQEAVRKHKQAKKARAEAESLRKENDLLKYASKGDMNSFSKRLNDMYEDDPDFVEDIASRNWGMSYMQLQQQAKSQVKDSAPDPTDIEALIDAKLSAREKKDRSVKVEKAEETFFIESNIKPTSRAFKNILDEYDSLKKEFGRPQNAAQATKLLKLAYYEYNKDVIETGGDADVSLPSNPRSSARTRDTSTQKRKVSPDVKAYMVERYGKKATEDYLAGKKVKFSK